MSIRRVPSLLVTLVLVAGAFAAGLAVATPASAQVPPTAVCKLDFAGMVGLPGLNNGYATSVATWMNQQLAAGRGQFFAVTPIGSPSMVCAW